MVECRPPSTADDAQADEETVAIEGARPGSTMDTMPSE
jgi:hypothetical protein